MTEIPGSQPAADPPSRQPASDKLVRRASFRWETLFQRSSDPLFVLSRRRLVFVNHAFEALSGITASNLTGLVCSRRTPAGPDLESAIARTLAPPPEALRGTSARSTRVVRVNRSAHHTWEIEYFPLRAGGRDTAEETMASPVMHVGGEPFSAITSAGGDQENVLCILGKITVARSEIPARTRPLPEKLLALRERSFQRYRLDCLRSYVPQMERVAHQVALACQTNVPVLIRGEPGTGKQWVGRTIHSQGTGRAGPFIALDCQRLPEGLIASFLTSDKGILHRAGPGTLYLREPACLPRELQQVIHDWLEEGPDKATFRLVAGTGPNSIENKDCERLLPRLHAALGTIVIDIPPLRDRLADMDLLIDTNLKRLTEGEALHPRTINPEAQALIRSYPWPGNLRELYEVLRGACRRAAGDTIGLEEMPASLRLLARMDKAPGPAAERSLPLDQILAQVEQRLIQLALSLAKGNKSRAADLLAIPRARLWRRLDQAE